MKTRHSPLPVCYPWYSNLTGVLNLTPHCFQTPSIAPAWCKGSARVFSDGGEDSVNLARTELQTASLNNMSALHMSVIMLKHERWQYKKRPGCAQPVP